MRVVFIDIKFGTPYARDLARGLAERGHDVWLLRAGAKDLLGTLRLERGRSGRIADIVNAPLTPQASGDPKLDISAPQVDRLVMQFVRDVEPALIHFHELSAVGLSVPISVSRMGYPTIVTIHNYWCLCPQLNLIDATGTRCVDYQDGASCQKCRWLPLATNRAMLDYAKTAFSDTPLFPYLSRARKVARQRFPNRNLIPPGWSEPIHSATLFRDRRAAGIAALNSVDVVHALSRRSAEVLADYGVDHSRLVVIPASTRALDSLQTRSPRPPGSPLKFAYRGSLSYVKGVHVLVEAFSRLPQDRVALDIHGEGEPDYEAFLRRLSGGLNVRFRGTYQSSDLDTMNFNTDVGVVPSIWEETLCFAGLEFIHGGVPVIASAIGGMLDYVDVSNGVVVKPGDVDELTNAMTMFVRDPGLISTKRPRPIPRHKLSSALDGMEAIYQKLGVRDAKPTPGTIVNEK